ncbi:hypothetical protein [Micromonospora carbonacea]|uniref:hypothetical protein n=1 Tax=Micromonospora carbonacea TaxID=47853 RepID=UPI00371AA2BD
MRCPAVRSVPAVVAVAPRRAGAAPAPGSARPWRLAGLLLAAVGAGIVTAVLFSGPAAADEGPGSPRHADPSAGALAPDEAGRAGLASPDGPRTGSSLRDPAGPDRERPGPLRGVLRPPPTPVPSTPGPSDPGPTDPGPSKPAPADPEPSPPGAPAEPGAPSRPSEPSAPSAPSRPSEPGAPAGAVPPGPAEPGSAAGRPAAVTPVPGGPAGPGTSPGGVAVAPGGPAAPDGAPQHPAVPPTDPAAAVPSVGSGRGGDGRLAHCLPQVVGGLTSSLGALLASALSGLDQHLVAPVLGLVGNLLPRVLPMPPLVPSDPADPAVSAPPRAGPAPGGGPVDPVDAPAAVPGGEARSVVPSGRSGGVAEAPAGTFLAAWPAAPAGASSGSSSASVRAAAGPTSAGGPGRPVSPTGDRADDLRTGSGPTPAAADASRSSVCAAGRHRIARPPVSAQSRAPGVAARPG